MNYIFISPQFPKNFENFVLKLRDKGTRVLGIGDSPYDQLSDELKEGLEEYYYVLDMEDYSQVLRAVGFFTFKYGKIDRIESQNEHFMGLDARLREDFNCFGLKPEDLNRLQSKSKMKEVFKSLNIPCAEGRIFYSYEDAKELFYQLGENVVIKPDRGVGTSDTYHIESLDGLDDFFSKRADLAYIMEEYVHGKIETFDGLTNKEGQAVLTSSMIYKNDSLSILENKGDLCYYIPRKVEEDIEDYGLKIIRAFDIRERFFHIEFFRGEDSSLKAIEINCRPPVGYSLDMIDYSNDIDIYDQYANVLRFDRFTEEVKRNYYCSYVSRRFYRPYKYSHEEILNRYELYMMKSGRMPQVFSDLMGNTFYIFRTKTYEKMEEIREDIWRLE